MATTVSKKLIHIFTKAFPYHAGEDFIGNELPFWTKDEFDVYLIPGKKGNGKLRNYPSKINLISDKPIYSGTLNKKLWFSNIFLISKILLIEFFHTDKKVFFLKNLKSWNHKLVEGLEDGEFIKEHLKTLDRTAYSQEIFYSFWMDTWATALALLKDKGEIDNFSFRILGFDIYDFRREGNYMPFRKYIYQQANKVFPNSKKAVDYVKAKDIYPEKIQLNYLGTNSKGLNPFDESAPLTIFSSAKNIPEKRLHLVFEILKNCQSSIKWVHFGLTGKTDMEDLKKLAKELPPNIEVQLNGRIEKFEDYINFFLTTPINFAINVSNIEGLPVTLQEALSFGIPVIATDVGGNREVAEGNGIVLPPDFDPKEVAKLVDAFKTSEKNTPEFRQKVRQFWEQNFQAKTQFERFTQEIL